MLPSSVSKENSNGYGTNITTRHNWTKEEYKKLMVCFYKRKPKQKDFMSHIEMLWRKKHWIASLDMKQLSNQRYTIVKKHLLLDLELEELSQLDELNDTVREELDDVSDSPAETSNVLIDEPPLFVKKLPSNIQALWKMIMDYLPTEQS